MAIAHFASWCYVKIGVMLRVSREHERTFFTRLACRYDEIYIWAISNLGTANLFAHDLPYKNNGYGMLKSVYVVLTDTQINTWEWCAVYRTLCRVLLT